MILEEILVKIIFFNNIFKKFKNEANECLLLLNFSHYVLKALLDVPHLLQMQSFKIVPHGEIKIPVYNFYLCHILDSFIINDNGKAISKQIS